jgi:hypothetical protein
VFVAQAQAQLRTVLAIGLQPSLRLGYIGTRHGSAARFSSPALLKRCEGGKARDLLMKHTKYLRSNISGSDGKAFLKKLSNRLRRHLPKVGGLMRLSDDAKNTETG